jgi:hypothetical protein
LVEDLKDSIYVVNDGAHIYTQPNDPFILELKDSPWWIVGGSFIMLYISRDLNPK